MRAGFAATIVAIAMITSLHSASARVSHVAASKSGTFRGHFKGSFILSLRGGTAIGTISARGRTSTLGRSTLNATASGPISLFGCTKVTGTGHVKAGKRGQVTYSFESQFCPGAAHDLGTFKLTTGTGTMAGVHGRGSFVMSPSGLTNPIPVTLDLSGNYRLPKT